jgi:hypothetical protein
VDSHIVKQVGILITATAAREKKRLAAVDLWSQLPCTGCRTSQRSASL